VGEKKVQLEREVNPSIAQKLSQMGHQVEVVNTNIGMGRGQIIWRMEDGTLIGGTEPRAQNVKHKLPKNYKKFLKSPKEDRLAPPAALFFSCLFPCGCAKMA